MSGPNWNPLSGMSEETQLPGRNWSASDLSRNTSDQAMDDEPGIIRTVERNPADGLMMSPTGFLRINMPPPPVFTDAYFPLRMPVSGRQSALSNVLQFPLQLLSSYPGNPAGLQQHTVATGHGLRDTDRRESHQIPSQSGFESTRQDGNGGSDCDFSTISDREDSQIIVFDANMSHKKAWSPAEWQRKQRRRTPVDRADGGGQHVQAAGQDNDRKKRPRSVPLPSENRPIKRSRRSSSSVSNTHPLISQEDCLFTLDPRNGQTRETPHRRLAPSDRARRVALRAAGGACLDCKRRKRKCEHVAVTTASGGDHAAAEFDSILSAPVDLKTQCEHANVTPATASEYERIQTNPDSKLSGSKLISQHMDLFTPFENGHVEAGLDTFSSVPSALHRRWNRNGTPSSGTGYHSLAATKATSVASVENRDSSQFLADFESDTNSVGSQFDNPIVTDATYALMANCLEDESWITGYL